MFSSLSSFLYSFSPKRSKLQGKGGRWETDLAQTGQSGASLEPDEKKLVNPAAPEAHISPQRAQGASLTVWVTVLKEGF